jgi:hypothetical protein
MSQEPTTDETADTRWRDAATTPDLSDDAETLVLVGCGAAKADEPRPAKDLYTSTYFGLKRAYAEEHGDEWAILSAKYGLLNPEAEIEPYDLTVDDVDVGEWGVTVAEALPDVRDTEVVVLAGPDYAEEIEGTLFLYGADVETPTEGMKIGERMEWLSDQLDEDADDQADSGDDAVLEGLNNGSVDDARDASDEQDADQDDEPDGPPWLWSYDGPERLATYLRRNYATTDRAKELATEFGTVEAFEAAPFEKKLRAAGVSGRAVQVILEEYDSLGDLQYRARSGHGLTALDGVGGTTAHRVGNAYLSWSSTSGAPPQGWNALVDGTPEIAPDGGAGDPPTEEPVAPDSLPKYLREGVAKQDAETLRDLATYADRMADYQEQQVKRELAERADQDPTETPADWEEDDWDEALDEALDKADVERGRGSIQINTIDGRDYYYLKWWDGDGVASQYIAPVAPKD